MPLIIDSCLPAVSALASGEGIHASGPTPSRPLRVGIVNLMPQKQMAELDLLRHLCSTPLQVEVELLDMASHTSRNTPASHIERFYRHFDAKRAAAYDGMIFTGAPVEKIAFEAVDYWEELCGAMDCAAACVRSSLYICWGAFAGLYRHHGVGRRILDRKLSGVYRHRPQLEGVPLLRGMDDEFHVPHSRYVDLDPEEIARHPELSVISRSDESGIHIVMARAGREFFITGHSEYAPLTLDSEYRRDLAKGIEPDMPVNYYRADDPSLGPVVRWRAHAALLFSNWLHHYVNPCSPHAPAL